ncbi:PD-(D/E)XK nuclease domain-containing protein [Lachnospiraceae bacterium ZAX-1]
MLYQSVYLTIWTYDLENKTEKHYQTVFYVVFTLMGQHIKAEVKRAIGRADAVVGDPSK